MSITIVTDLFCDECCDWDSDLTICSYRSKTREMLREARQHGWIRKKRDGKMIDLCPECQKKRKEMKNNVS